MSDHQIKPSTYFALMAEFGMAHIPIEIIGKKYFGYDEKTANARARESKYPFSVFRAGGQKSQWLVDIGVLAKYLDSVIEKAEKQFRTAKGG
jgi:hypothetical protein